MSMFDSTDTFTCAADITTIERARQYLRLRMGDAIACHAEDDHLDVIALAKYLLTHW